MASASEYLAVRVRPQTRSLILRCLVWVGRARVLWLNQLPVHLISVSFLWLSELSLWITWLRLNPPKHNTLHRRNYYALDKVYKLNCCSGLLRTREIEFKIVKTLLTFSRNYSSCHVLHKLVQSFSRSTDLWGNLFQEEVLNLKQILWKKACNKTLRAKDVFVLTTSAAVVSWHVAGCPAESYWVCVCPLNQEDVHKSGVRSLLVFRTNLENKVYIMSLHRNVKEKYQDG